MRTRQLLSITCSVALIQGTAAFSRGAFVARSTSFTTSKSHAFQNTMPQSKRRNVGGDSSLQMAASHLFSFQRMTAQDDPLVNNRYSASDWLHNVFTLPRSSVLRDIRNPVVTIAVWSTLVSIFHRLISRSSSGIFQKLASDMCIGGAPHSFLVSSLGLLLVFRTNSAYQRFNVSTN